MCVYRECEVPFSFLFPPLSFSSSSPSNTHRADNHTIEAKDPHRNLGQIGFHHKERKDVTKSTQKEVQDADAKRLLLSFHQGFEQGKEDTKEEKESVAGNPNVETLPQKAHGEDEKPHRFKPAHNGRHGDGSLSQA
jgi:hypothetical protein